MGFYLGDDGTMDTVIVCDDCGQETRFNYDASNVDETENTVEQDNESGGYWRIRFHGDLLSVGYATKQDAENLLNEWLYDEWIESCIEDCSQDHDCDDDCDDDN